MAIDIAFEGMNEPFANIKKLQASCPSAVDPDLGVRLWGGKDEDENIIIFLGKDKPARVSSLTVTSLGAGFVKSNGSGVLSVVNIIADDLPDHNGFNGLNEGDYLHLTAAEYSSITGSVLWGITGDYLKPSDLTKSIELSLATESRWDLTSKRLLALSNNFAFSLDDPGPTQYYKNVYSDGSDFRSIGGVPATIFAELAGATQWLYLSPDGGDGSTMHTDSSLLINGYAKKITWTGSLAIGTDTITTKWDNGGNWIHFGNKHHIVCNVDSGGYTSITNGYFNGVGFYADNDNPATVGSDPGGYLNYLFYAPTDPDEQLGASNKVGQFDVHGVNGILSWSGQLKLGIKNTAGTDEDGSIRYTGSDIEGRVGGSWISLTSISTTPAHNDTTLKQGGTTGEYYHLTSAQYQASARWIYEAASAGNYPENVYLNENWLGVGDHVQNDWGGGIGIEIGWRHGLMDQVDEFVVTANAFIGSSQTGSGNTWSASEGHTSESLYGMGLVFDCTAGQFIIKKSALNNYSNGDPMTMEDLFTVDDTDIKYKGVSLEKKASSKSITFPDAQALDNIAMFYTTEALKISKVRAAKDGGTLCMISITSQTNYNSPLTTHVNNTISSEEILTGNGSDLTILEAVIPAGRYVVLNSIASTGMDGFFPHVTMEF